MTFFQNFKTKIFIFNIFKKFLQRNFARVCKKNFFIFVSTMPEKGLKI